MQFVNTIVSDLVSLNPGSAPVVVEALGRNSISDGGGGRFLWQPASVEVPNGGTIFASSAVSGARWLRLYERHSAHVAWFGAYGRWDGAASGAPDDAIGIQAAINASQGKTVVFAATKYRIATPLILRSSTNLRGSGPLDGGTILMADLNAGAGPGTLGAGEPYPPTLSTPPIVYNFNAVQWLAIEDLVLDGRNQDVYGLYLYRNYYLTIRNVRISRCNRRPYVNILGQLVHHDKLAIYDNGAGAVTYASTSMAFNSCGFERNSGDYHLQVRQPNDGFSKGGTTLDSCWFEVSEERMPSQGYLAVSGRGIIGKSLFFTNSNPSLNGIACLANGGTLLASDAGHLMTTGPAMGAILDGVNYSGGATSKTSFGAGSTGCTVHGFVAGSEVNDQSVTPPAVSTNQVRCIGSGIDFPYALDRFQVRDSTVAGFPGIPTQPNSHFHLDVQAEQTRFYGPNNYMRLNSGIFELASNITMRLQCGIDPGNQIVLSNRNGASTWQTGHLLLGGHHIWVDAASKLRIKSSAPASDTDGTVVGSQS